MVKHRIKAKQQVKLLHWFPKRGKPGLGYIRKPITDPTSAPASPSKSDLSATSSPSKGSSRPPYAVNSEEHIPAFDFGNGFEKGPTRPPKAVCLFSLCAFPPESPHSSCLHRMTDNLCNLGCLFGLPISTQFSNRKAREPSVFARFAKWQMEVGGALTATVIQPFV